MFMEIKPWANSETLFPANVSPCFQVWGNKLENFPARFVCCRLAVLRMLNREINVSRAGNIGAMRAN